jgi:hypothetical protein
VREQRHELLSQDTHAALANDLLRSVDRLRGS